MFVRIAYFVTSVWEAGSGFHFRKVRAWAVETKQSFVDRKGPSKEENPGRLGAWGRGTGTEVAPLKERSLDSRVEEGSRKAGACPALRWGPLQLGGESRAVHPLGDGRPGAEGSRGGSDTLV